MIVAALSLTIEKGPNNTVKLTQPGIEPVLLSREDWGRIVATVDA